MRALIFGSSGGIGSNIALELMANGWEVIGASPHAIEGATFEQYIVDVREPDQIAQAVEKAGRFDALIYCTGIGLASPAQTTTRKDYVNLFDVNLFGLFEAVKYALNTMPDGGRIIAISSMASVLPIPFNSFYCASKSAINTYMEILDTELAPRKIRATTILPGGVCTDFSKKRKKYSSDDQDYQTPLKQSIKELTDDEQGGVKPEKVAKAVLDVLTNPHPPLIHPIGAMSKAHYTLEKLLPKSVTQSILTNKYTQ